MSKLCQLMRLAASCRIASTPLVSALKTVLPSQWTVEIWNCLDFSSHLQRFAIPSSPPFPALHLFRSLAVFQLNCRAFHNVSFCHRSTLLTHFTAIVPSETFPFPFIWKRLLNPMCKTFWLKMNYNFSAETLLSLSFSWTNFNGHTKFRLCSSVKTFNVRLPFNRPPGRSPCPDETL